MCHRAHQGCADLAKLTRRAPVAGAATALALLLSTLLFSTSGWAQDKTLSRDIEEVVVKAESGTNRPFADFIGQPTDRIHLYRYDASYPDRFRPIPFQVDRKHLLDLSSICGLEPNINCEINYHFDANGDPVGGSLADGDEIVFLATDSGPRAPDTTIWKQGNVGTVRYEVEIQDVRLVDGVPEIQGQGWIYAFAFLETHAYESFSYTSWTPNTAPDGDRPGQICQTGDPNVTRGRRSCGLFKGLRGPNGELDARTRYQLRYLGHWIINRAWMIPPGSDVPNGEFIDRNKFRAYGQAGENEVGWSTALCANFRGLKVGPVRTIFYAQGAASGPFTTRTDWLYPTHYRSQVKLRVHDRVTGILEYVDHLQSFSGSEIFVRSGSPITAADVINGQPPASFPGQWEDWTQVNSSLGRVVRFFEETRPLNAGPPSYHYEDTPLQHDPEFEDGAYGNYGEKWPGPTPDLQDITCILDPNDPSARYRQFDTTVFFAPVGAGGNTDEAQAFADFMTRPLRAYAYRQTYSVPPPPPDPGPICPPTLSPSVNPENGRYLDLQPTVSGCTDSTASFVLYRAVTGGEYQFVTKVRPGLSFRDWHVFRGQTYHYKVRGANVNGVEGPASEVLTFDAIDNETPPSPIGLVVETWDHSLNVTWDKSTAWDVHGYNMYVSTTPGGPYVRANTALILIPSRAFTASGLENGTTYFAVVRTVDWGGNESSNSAEVSGTPGP